jgi:hypothetical protein
MVMAIGFRPAPVSAAVNADGGTCEVIVTLNWVNLVTANLAPNALAVTNGIVGGGSCVGTNNSGSISFQGWGGVAGVSCDALDMVMIQAHVSWFGAPVGSQYTAPISAIGSPMASVWLFPASSGGAMTFLAAGAFAWDDTTQIQTCHESGVRTMRLTGVLVYEDPSVS